MDFQRILIVQTAYLGDTVLITPLIRAARRIFPQAQIDVLVIPQTAGVLQNNPHLNRIVIFDKRHNKRAAFIHTLQELRATRYDLAITPHSSFTTGLLLKMAGIPYRVGFDRSPIRYFLTRRVQPPETGHTIEKNLALLQPFSSQTFSMQTELFPTAAQHEKAQTLLRYLPPDRPKIAIAPGSVWPTKRWPREYYRDLVRALQARFSFVFIGSKDERALCSRIIREAQPEHAVNVAGELSLLESAAAIAQCDLMVCNDSGALHLANAMQTDVFAFFGPTIKDFGFYPFRPNDFVFEVSDLYCRPCGTHGHKKCPEGHFRCMREITPPLVVQKILRHFSPFSKDA
jgi:heptosyltransferase-2